MIVQIPFPGFYESVLSQGMDDAEEQLCEYLAEHDERFASFTANDIADAIYWTASYGLARRYLAEQYAGVLADVLHDETDRAVAWAFESMESPREYNFTTDRVFVTMEANALDAMRKEIDAETWARVLIERHMSRDGFSSFYSHDPDDWQGEATADLDHNEAETVLLAWIESRGIEDVEFRVYERLSENAAFDAALDKAIDLAAALARLSEREA